MAGRIGDSVRIIGDSVGRSGNSIQRGVGSVGISHNTVDHRIDAGASGDGVLGRGEVLGSGAAGRSSPLGLLPLGIPRLQMISLTDMCRVDIEGLQP